MTTNNTPPAGDTVGGANSGGAGDTEQPKPKGGTVDAGSSDTDGAGDTADVAALQARVAELEKENRGLAADRDKGIRKRESQRSDFESRLQEVEDKLKSEQATNAAEREARTQAVNEARTLKTTQAVIAELHADHQTSKTAQRVVRSLQTDGLDFTAEDRKPVVASAIETLKKDHPEFFVAKPRGTEARLPQLPDVQNSKVTPQQIGGARNAKGERLI